MGKQIRFGRMVRLAAVMVGLSLVAGAAQAAQLVTFMRGQSIVVQSVEMRGGWYYFILEGGGEVGVPVKQVVSIEEYEAPPPSLGSAAASSPVAPPAAAPTSPQAAAQAVLPQPDSGGSASRLAEPGTEPPPSQPNTAVQGDEDWRYKVRMSGGPRKGMQNSYGAAGPGAMGGGGRLPVGAVKPGTLRPYPPQQQNPQK